MQLRHSAMESGRVKTLPYRGIAEKTPGRGNLPGVNRTVLNYRYLAVLTLTPGPMVEATVQERIY